MSVFTLPSHKCSWCIYCNSSCQYLYFADRFVLRLLRESASALLWWIILLWSGNLGFSVDMKKNLLNISLVTFFKLIFCQYRFTKTDSETGNVSIWPVTCSCSNLWSSPSNSLLLFTSAPNKAGYPPAQNTTNSHPEVCENPLHQ